MKKRQFPKKFYVTKASKETEFYNEGKILKSLKRSGVPINIAASILESLRKKIRPGMSTEEIYNLAFSSLLRVHPSFAGRYSLKRAIMEMGPAGFLFEQYISAVLNEYGYSTNTNAQVAGRCAVHEIDVVAEKDGETHLIEAKYHNTGGIKSDIKVVMYMYARLLDIRVSVKNGEKYSAWLVTNTKFTSSAKSYAKCMGIKLTGWRYPAKGGLEEIIESKGLYPVTIFPAVGQFSRERFAEKKVYFAKDIASLSPEEISVMYGISQKTSREIANQAKPFFARI